MSLKRLLFITLITFISSTSFAKERLVLMPVVTDGGDKMVSVGLSAKKTIRSSDRYAKISSRGKVLSDSATDWACVQDSKTGLMWERKQTDGGIQDKSKKYTFHEAPDYAKRINHNRLCDFSGWRMPTKGELKTLVIKGKKPTINADYFSNTVSSNFWSGSSYDDYPFSAWYVSFSDGYDYGYNESSSYAVRVVRDGQ